MKSATFNTAARQHLGERTKIRIANFDGTFRVRPTDRKAGANLPKGQKLLDLSAGKTALPDGVDVPAGKYALHEDRYGWFVMQPGATGRGPQVTIG